MIEKKKIIINLKNNEDKNDNIDNEVWDVLIGLKISK